MSFRLQIWSNSEIHLAILYQCPASTGSSVMELIHNHTRASSKTRVSLLTTKTVFKVDWVQIWNTTDLAVFHGSL